MLADEADAGAVKLMVRLSPCCRSLARSSRSRDLALSHAFFLRLSPQVGECFIDCAPSEAGEHVARELESAKAAKGALEAELKAAEARMGALKKVLYARFGKSINLEE